MSGPGDSRLLSGGNPSVSYMQSFPKATTTTTITNASKPSAICKTARTAIKARSRRLRSKGAASQ